MENYTGTDNFSAERNSDFSVEGNFTSGVNKDNEVLDVFQSSISSTSDDCRVPVQAEDTQNIGINNDICMELPKERSEQFIPLPPLKDNILNNQDMVDVDRTQSNAIDNITDCATEDNVCNKNSDKMDWTGEVNVNENIGKVNDVGLEVDIPIVTQDASGSYQSVPKVNKEFEDIGFQKERDKVIEKTNFHHIGDLLNDNTGSFGATSSNVSNKMQDESEFSNEAPANFSRLHSSEEKDPNSPNESDKVEDSLVEKMDTLKEENDKMMDDEESCSATKDKEENTSSESIIHVHEKNDEQDDSKEVEINEPRDDNLECDASEQASIGSEKDLDKDKVQEQVDDSTDAADQEVQEQAANSADVLTEDKLQEEEDNSTNALDKDQEQAEDSTNVMCKEKFEEKLQEQGENSTDALDKDKLQEQTPSESDKDKLLEQAENSADASDKEKSFNQRENTEFVRVNTENEKDGEDNDKEDDTHSRALMEHDPIASDSFEPINNEDREGADEELCIIPDTHREISQAEKDAASVIPPLRDLTEASASVQSDKDFETAVTDHSLSTPIIVFKYDKEDLQICDKCKLKRKVKYYFSDKDLVKYLCDDNCLNVFKDSQENKVILNWEEGSLRVKNFTGTAKEPPSLAFIRKCAACKKITDDIENNLTWEIMDFCNEFCLSNYQKEIGSHCSSCQGEVKSNSLGKYCVRFGNDIRQFCTSLCLEKYKKGLKVCSYCQQDMSGGPTGFLAPVGDKGQFKDFCSQLCMEKYDIMTNDRPPKVAEGTICSVCKAEKPITIEFELQGSPNYFCSEPCFVAFSFVNNISPGKCAMCRRHFPKSVLEKHTMYYDNVQHSFCSNSCENIYIIAHRKIVPCSWCKVKKYNFDMIRRYSKTGPLINMCSVNCLSLYRVSINAVSSRKTICNFCQKLTHPMYHLTMSDATIRNFCSYNCVMGFQNQFPKQPITLNTLGESGLPVPTGAPKKNKKHPGVDTGETAPQLPIISSVQSLASSNGSIGQAVNLPPGLTPITTRTTRSKTTTNSTQLINSAPQIINSLADLPVQVQIKQHFIVRPAPLPEQRNVSTMCYTRKANKGTSMKPIMVDEAIQTEEREASKILIPVPVPIYVPTPMRVYSVPVPVPVPFPVPVPVPIFIPTTRNSAAGIMKEIKKIQVKIPTDPYEAELLMMAEMVAEEKKEEPTDSESDVDDAGGPEDSYSPEPVDASNTFGDDMLQMALKMATELDEPAVDLEGALTANTITAPQGGEAHPHPQDENVDDPQPMHHIMERSQSARGRKRGMRQSRGGAKRGRRMSHQVDMPIMQQIQQPPPPPEPAEKPDANMCLKYTFGVNAWKQWVTTKNAELEKSSLRVMQFKTEILQLTADELNYSLCLFVKEVRKPNGAEYAPDTIYYLCLGIQQYLFENGRIDNIFCDPYYEKFTDCLDEVAKKFSVLYNDSHYIVTRVEEEHLWESKQLGAHSPHVLLSTLMFFNTKHFNLTSVDEHMQLSFSHIMKHWKRNPNQPSSKIPGSRNVLLRFYPPQSAIQNNARKKKVYEQEQNEENPLRCPVKLPESVKTRNDVFYLQPERSCVPDSPVWYSTMPLPKEALEKMLHRVKMVKEINVALLTS
ncbi:hypothetical protein NQ315_015064 [Exocentrus adspersus]|uniref:TRASH domain-containing protein n=1 Tax=Exocentrus adspersus TaxID=1586481 RepID=A0AAV8VWW8_9CUCU|nr:hypothetical protein NQ315_015064 [Exocentrus adspersus]